MNWPVLINAAVLVYSALTMLDILIFMFRSAPKSTFFGKAHTLLGFIGTVYLVYTYATTGSIF